MSQSGSSQEQKQEAAENTNSKNNKKESPQLITPYYVYTRTATAISTPITYTQALRAVELVLVRPDWHNPSSGIIRSAW